MSGVKTLSYECYCDAIDHHAFRLKRTPNYIGRSVDIILFHNRTDKNVHRIRFALVAARLRCYQWWISGHCSTGFGPSSDIVVSIAKYLTSNRFYYITLLQYSVTPYE